LEHFFPDNPINVTISAFKETKSNDAKPQINLDIDYRGIEHDLSMLSGGEMSRVILAFTLALAEIQDSPLILLDECTSSLDHELTSSVIDGLKENFGEKLVLLIAHQVVQGSFDKVVNLS
jgi:ABC-type transport system involved in cytochrome bd biosynthesis fused ATPase/permease subunit